MHFVSGKGTKLQTSWGIVYPRKPKDSYIYTFSFVATQTRKRTRGPKLEPPSASIRVPDPTPSLRVGDATAADATRTRGRHPRQSVRFNLLMEQAMLADARTDRDDSMLRRRRISLCTCTAAAGSSTTTTPAGLAGRQRLAARSKQRQREVPRRQARAHGLLCSPGSGAEP
jgi:hypothetical protein